MAFEDRLRQGLQGGSRERTFIDKVLARDDVNAIRELIKKPILTREELLEILYLISGTESKLLNYNEWDRYVILKFFVWIREFIKIAEILYDYEDELKKKENTCKNCKRFIETEEQNNKCLCKLPEPYSTLTPRAKKLLLNNSLLIQHNAKFLIDLYLNIARTSMSLNAAAFVELLKNKYEVIYPQQPVTTQVEQKGGLFKWKKE